MTDTQRPTLLQDTASLTAKLQEQRRTVDFDPYDIHVLQLLSQLETGQIWTAPAYQRQFRWDVERCSSLVESLLLGIPIPNLFMATDEKGAWEVVDGVQRLSAIAKFAGNATVRAKLNVNGPLVLEGLDKLDNFNGLSFNDLPQNIQTHFHTRSLRVVTLSDKSNPLVRYDLFERLNTGGIGLTPQEIRDCVFQGPFAKRLEDLSKEANFRKVVKLTAEQEKNGTAEECVLRFFAFRDRYEQFVHSVVDFLNDYMADATRPPKPGSGTVPFDMEPGTAAFHKTFAELAKAFPEGLRRDGRKGGVTSLILYEAVAVGASLALKSRSKFTTAGLSKWLASEELRGFTTGATNNKSAVKGRIEFCRDRFLGKPYVSTASA